MAGVRFPVCFKVAVMEGVVVLVKCEQRPFKYKHLSELCT